MPTKEELANILLGSVPCPGCSKVPPIEKLVVWDTDHKYLIEYYTAARMRRWMKYSGKALRERAPKGEWGTLKDSYLLCEECSKKVFPKVNLSYLCRNIG